jgi:hypothetical protein
MSDAIVVKDDKPSVIYRYTPNDAATVVPGVPARDLTEFDLAAMSVSQRLAVKRIAAQDGGAYALKGTVPRGLSLDPESEVVESTELEVQPDPEATPDAEPAGRTRKKG